jgi:flagellar hook-associated protein 1
MSINQLINISRRSFSALDGAMNATAQNVANMETEGYTRRRVTLQSVSNVPQGLYTPPFGKVGTGGGVSVQEYERLRDGLLQKSGWEARSGLGGFDAQHRLLLAVEGVSSEAQARARFRTSSQSSTRDGPPSPTSRMTRACASRFAAMPRPSPER